MSSSKSSKIDSSANQSFVIGNYIVSQTIGQGTYGKVRLGSHIQTKEKVAVKVIEKSQVKSAKQIARLQREIRFLKLLHHPHIIRLYDVIETPQNIFIVMEYATGGELFDYIVANKRVKEVEARGFFRMVIKAIDYCHKNAIIHRDLKPENLLLDENKQIKIIDFGFGNNYSNEKLLDTFCGSPFYAAPEMILGKKYTGPEVDMWSLGVILFALLCGHLPFDDENMKELYKKIANGTYRCPDYVMPNARHLIGRLITVDPRKRATMREVFNHPWVNEGFSCQPENDYLQPNPIKNFKDLSQDIVGRLVIFGYSIEEIVKAFEIQHEDIGAPNPIRSTYFLLKDMVDREQSRIIGKKPIQLNAFLKEKESSTLTLVSSSEYSLYSTSINHTTSSHSNDIIKPPPGAHISPRTHSTKIPAHEMDLMEFEPSQQNNSISNESSSEVNSRGLFGFSLAQAAASQIQRLYSVPSSLYNSLSETTNALLYNRDADLTTDGKESIGSCSTRAVKKDPNTIVNDIIRVLSGTDARWHFESELRIICEMNANSYLPGDGTELDDTVGRNQPKKYISPKTVAFSIEVGKTANNQPGVFFRRLHGGVWNYKRICTKLVQIMKL